MIAEFVTWPKTVPYGGRVTYELEEKVYAGSSSQAPVLDKARCGPLTSNAILSRNGQIDTSSETSRPFGDCAPRRAFSRSTRMICSAVGQSSRRSRCAPDPGGSVVESADWAFISLDDCCRARTFVPTSSMRSSTTRRSPSRWRTSSCKNGPSGRWPRYRLQTASASRRSEADFLLAFASPTLFLSSPSSRRCSRNSTPNCCGWMSGWPRCAHARRTFSIRPISSNVLFVQIPFHLRSLCSNR